MMLKNSAVMLKNDRGLTLIEVLASVVILGIVISLFISFSGDTLNASKQSERSTTAITIAEQVMNNIRNDLSNAVTNNNNQPLTLNQINTVLIPYQEPNVNKTFNISSIYSVTAQSSGPYSDFKQEPTYNTSSFGKHHVSIQSMVMVNPTSPYQYGYIIVTVSWGDT